MSARPFNVCMLGSMAAGKSTFLAGLAILGEPNRSSGLTVRGLNEKSVSYLKELGDTLRLQQWPGPTNRVELFEIEVTTGGRILNLLILDYPGDDFRVQLQRFVDGAADELRARLTEAEACLLLLDPERELRPESELTDAERNHQVERLNALVNTVADLRSKRQPGTPLPGPAGTRTTSPPWFPDLAVVVTKADLVTELSDAGAAEAYLQSRVPAVLDRFRLNAKHVRYFAVSAVGATERTPEGYVIPAPRGQLAPRGYRELFEWLVGRRKFRRWWPAIAAGLLVVGISVGLGTLYTGKTMVERTSIEESLRNEAIPPVERLKSSLGCPLPLRTLRQELFEWVLTQTEEDLRKAASERDLQDVSAKLGRLMEYEPGPLLGRCEELRRQALERRVALRFEEVRRARDGKHSAFREMAERFRADFLADPRAEEVGEWLGMADSESFEEEKRSVFRLTVSDDRSLAVKLERIAAFLKQYGPKLGKRAVVIRRALELGTQFRSERIYQVKLVRTGEFTSPRYQFVQVFIDGKFHSRFDAPTAATVQNWDRTIQIVWKLGMTVNLDLFQAGYVSNSHIASLTGTGPLALEAFSSPRQATTQRAGWGGSLKEGAVRFNVHLMEVSADDFRALDSYILPGDEWNRSWEAPP